MSSYKFIYSFYSQPDRITEVDGKVSASPSLVQVTDTKNNRVFEFANGEKVELAFSKMQFCPMKLPYPQYASLNETEVFKSSPMGVSSLTFYENKKKSLTCEFYANGQPACATPYTNGKINGRRLFWDQEGHLAREEMYKDGQHHGFTVAYWEDGSTHWICDYRNGLENGPFMSYYKGNGRLQFRCTCENGMRQGEYYELSCDGQIVGKGIYKNNVKTQVWKNTFSPLSIEMQKAEQIRAKLCKVCHKDCSRKDAKDHVKE